MPSHGSPFSSQSSIACFLPCLHARALEIVGAEHMGLGQRTLELNKAVSKDLLSAGCLCSLKGVLAG